MTGYFEEQIATGQAIVPPTEVQEAEVVKPMEGEWPGLPVRTNGDKVFLLKGGKKAWITSKEVLERLGFKLGDEVKIDQATLDIIPEGDPIR